jgi:hypothetical protein
MRPSSLALALAVLAACRGTPPAAPPQPEPLPPLIRGSVSSYWGDFLEGPRAAPLEAPERTLGRVRLRARWLQGPQPELATAPALEPSGGLLVGINRSQPVLPEASLLRRLRLVEALPAEARLWGAVELEAARLPGASASFVVELPEAELILRLEAAEGAAADQAPRFGLWIDGPAPAPLPSPFADPAPATAAARIEELMELPVGDGRLLVLSLPESSGWMAFEFEFDAELAAAGSEALFAAARASADRAAARALQARQPFDRRAFEAQRRRSALEALSRPERARAALLTLADPGGARLAGDLALAAATPDLAEFAALAGQRLASEPAALAEAGAAGLALERLALEMAVRWSSEGRLADELEAALWLHGGELGRFPGTWLELARDAASIADLERAIVQENLSFLEDPTPAARVRAFDFLTKRGLAPAGFDPLASREARRQALAAAAEAAAAAESAAAQGSL